MQQRRRLAPQWLGLMASVGALHIAGAAEPPPQSLAEKRMGFIKGTTPGIVLLDFGTAPPRAAASAPAGNSTQGQANVSGADSGATSGTSATGSSGQAHPSEAKPAVGNVFLNSLPPPSGRSLQSARRLDAPDQGVPLRTARDLPATKAPEPAR